MPTNRKGARTERELVRELSDRGWQSLRLAASGGGTDRELPDVLAAKAGGSVAIEAKASADERIYIAEREITDLRSFALPFGSTPLLGARFDREQWRFFDPNDCHRTDGGSFRIKRDRVEAGDGFGFEDL